jgi:peptidyl-prolyl cis-trans isomerase SurA
MRFSRNLLVIGSVLLAAAPMVPAEIVNGIACKVGGDIITIYEFNTTYEQVRERAQLFGVPAPNKREVLDELIDGLLIAREADRRGLVVTERELDEIIQNIKDQNDLSDEEFSRQLEAEGLTIEGLREQYRKEIVRSRLVNYFVTGEDMDIGEDEIRSFYDDPQNRRFFMTQGSVNISQIYVPVAEDLSYQDAKELKDRALRIAEEARNSDDFEALVMQYSAAANKDQNRGNLGSFSQDQLLSIMSPQNVSIIFSLEQGDVTPPIRLQDGYYIFRVNQKVDAKRLEYEESRERIKSFLLKIKAEERLKEWLQDERAATRIQIVMDTE